MEYRPYGPRGAESEREDFWTDIPEGSDMVPALGDELESGGETDTDTELN